jgi:hypothetical protein
MKHRLKYLCIAITAVLISAMIFSAFVKSPVESNFEGYIMYDLKFIPIHPKATVEFLQANYGVTETVYYKDGFYKRFRLSEEGDTILTIQFDPLKKRLYVSHIDYGDTLVTYKSTDNIFRKYEVSDLESEEVLGEQVFGIRIDYEFTEEQRYGPNTKISKYYFDKRFKLDPEDYSDFRDGFFNEIIEKYPFLVVKSIQNDGFLKKETKTAIEIRRTEVDPKIFEIDQQKPLKEI